MRKSDSKDLEVFGYYPVNRVLDFLMKQNKDLAMSDIARLSGVGYSTLKLFWPKLEANGLILFTRKVGKAKMYVLNKKNKAVKNWLQLYKSI